MHIARQGSSYPATIYAREAEPDVGLDGCARRGTPLGTWNTLDAAVWAASSAGFASGLDAPPRHTSAQGR